MRLSIETTFLVVLGFEISLTFLLAEAHFLRRVDGEEVVAALGHHLGRQLQLSIFLIHTDIGDSS